MVLTKLKKIVLSAMMGLFVIGAGVSLSSGDLLGVSADPCTHSGNHYTELHATETESGTHEYWVCCKCHEHFLSKPSGSWSDAGVASQITDSNDDRYIAIGTPHQNEQGVTLSADGKTILSYNPVEGETDIIIPEGVETIPANVFKGTDITSVILPESLKEIEKGAFQDCESLDSIVIPGGVMEIGTKAFYDNDKASVWTSANDIVIYLNITKAEADSRFEDGWETAYSSSILGWGLIGNEDHDAKVYYKDQWHYDENGNPTPNTTRR